MKCEITIVKLHAEKLIMTERIETLVPSTYILCFLMGWYGPNAELLGNIKLDFWQYAPVEHLGATLQTLTTLLIVDFCSLIINGIVLWKLARINILKSLQILQRDFWLLMAVYEWTLFVEVRYLDIIRRRGHRRPLHTMSGH